MGIFRKRETYNEQMLREAGLDRVVFKDPAPAPSEQYGDPPPLDTGRIPLSYALNVEVASGPMGWDTVTTARVPGLAGDRVEFTTLPNGDVIVEKEQGDGDLSPLADAIEEHVSPPYKAAGARQDGDLWGVGAKRIVVEHFAFPEANALELTQSDGVAELRAEGEPSDAAPPVELQRLGEQAGTDYCVEAQRIDGDDWEVKVSPL